MKKPPQRPASGQGRASGAARDDERRPPRKVKSIPQGRKTEPRITAKDGVTPKALPGTGESSKELSARAKEARAHGGASKTPRSGASGSRPPSSVSPGSRPARSRSPGSRSPTPQTERPPAPARQPGTQTPGQASKGHMGGTTRGLVISQASARFVQAGHCWVTRDRDTGDTGRQKPGDVVDLVTAAGDWLGRAMLDPEAKIVARVLTRDRRVLCNKTLFRERALEALRMREGLETRASMYRLINAEADGLPGLVIDRYGDWLVGQLYTPAAERLAEAAFEALLDTPLSDSLAASLKYGAWQGAYLKLLPRDRRNAGDDAPGRWVVGGPGPESLVEHEGAMKLRVRPFTGLATGLFLDQRDNRQKVAELARGRRVLNAFAYTGAFSVACALNGATVDTLDLSAKVLEQARDNFELNGIDLAGHQFLAADALPFLAGATGVYEMVIVDPPTFSTSRGNIWSPARLGELNALAMGALKPGGWLVSSSNFAGLSEEDFLEALRSAAAEAHRELRIVAMLQPGIDFPWLPGFPESRHFKGAIARVD